jgi:hypothetical protein
MEKIVSVILTLALMAGMTVFTAQPASALTSQETYYLATLKPVFMPRAKESYPAKLLVKSTIRGIPSNLTFTGNCGVNAEVPDEEMLKMLKESLSAVSTYKELQNPADDKLLIESLTQKLDFTSEDLNEILDNWAKMLGYDEVLDLVDGNIPIPDAGDAINAVIDGAQGENPLKPGPSVVGAFVAGVFITYEQYQKDIEKWENIVKLSQAKARIRAYYSELAEKIRAYLAEHGDWKITINAQELSEMSYNQMPNAATLIWTADIDLKKTDGGFTTAAGTYSGVFKLSADADFSNYDSGYAQFYADSINVKGAPFPYYVTGNSGPSSELKLAYEIPNCKLNISLPHGVTRHFFEENIPNTALTQTEFTIKSDRTVELRSNSNPYVTMFWQQIEDDGVLAQNQATTVHYPAPIGPQTTNNNDGYNDPWPPDTRGSITMTLVIDMLGK